MNNKILEKFKKIKLLVADFDGVMTDGYVYVDQNGSETVRCSRKDGLGIELLRKQGIETIVLSKEKNPVVQARCKKLAIVCFNSIDTSENKLAILNRLARAKKLSLEQVAYIGDDVNDLAVLREVGVAITVADSHELVKECCDYVTVAAGGAHAVRDVCEQILCAQGVKIYC